MKARSLCLAFLLGGTTAATHAAEPLPSIGTHTASMRHIEGFVGLYRDDATGHLHMELDPGGPELLYQVSLASGLGSNPVGLDRGQLGGTHVLRPERVGPRLLLVERNYRFRAQSANPDEVRAVEEAFTPSVYWGFEIEAESDGRVLVDATDFLVRDSHGAARRMEAAGQGKFQLDRSRSVVYPDLTRGFPLNTEIETLLTFTSDEPGPLVRSVAANAHSVTLRQHHSLVKLPDGDYTPRKADPRVGTIYLSFFDYAKPIDQDLDVRWAIRHRLQKKNPRAARSEPVAPIVYYLDRGVPEPVRGALVEGASWWNEAFEAAGFVNAFRVEMLPEDADPMDLRYNVIHWTHRSTRGWSYGNAVVDPRTGEILKGNVNLGSLRLRQDRLIGQGLVPPYAATSPAACGLSAAPGFAYLAEATGADPVAMALARVRQLSAHEVGHTLGFPHNYIASTYGGRASVMDYPAPLVGIRDGRLDLDGAYARGIGIYDKHAINWLYRELPPGTDEDAALEAIVADGLKKGLRFMGHTDNAFVGAAHEYASVWDNGKDLVEELARVLEVRKIALDSLSESAIRRGEPVADLEAVLVPLYLHHRFQLSAAAQTLGGADYTYAVRGDGQVPVRIAPPDRQRRALELLLQTLSVDFLTLPERLLALLPPPVPDESFDGEPAGAERFAGHTGLTFDPLAAAATAADFTVAALLHPDRLSRLVEYGSRENGPDVAAVADGLIEATWAAPRPADAYPAEVLRTVQRVVLDRLMERATDHPVSQVRAVLTDRVVALHGRLVRESSTDPGERLAVSDIERWRARNRPDTPPPAPPAAPPGSPIGN